MSDPVDPNRVPTPLSAPFEASRENAISALTKAFEQGAVNLDEYEERLELATTASTAEALAVLSRDLPAAQAAHASVPANRAPVSGPSKISTIFGNKKQQGAWVLAPFLKATSIFGTIWLDLRDVSWPEGGAEIQCKNVFGKIVLIIPPQVHVDCRGGSVLGDFNNALDAFSGEKTKQLVVSGSSWFGTVTLKTGYPKGIGRQ